MTARAAAERREAERLKAELKRGERAGFQSDEAHLFPLIINVNVLRGKCKCKCVHCPVGVVPVSERESRFNYDEMELELYMRITDEIRERGPSSALRIHSVGETMLWKNIQPAVRYSRDAAVRTWLFTSAALKCDDLFEVIAENIDLIEISVNSTDPEDYRKTKGIEAFELVKRNIEFMRRHIARQGLETCLIASRVQTRDRALDEDFVRYWRATGLVDDAFVRSHHTYNDLIEMLEEDGGIAEHRPCLVHWARFSIDTNGDGVVCFNELFRKNLDSRLIYGNVRETSIAEIWRGEKMRALRHAELTGDYENLPFGDALPCRDCTSCQPLFGDRETSENQLKRLKCRESRGAADRSDGA